MKKISKKAIVIGTLCCLPLFPLADWLSLNATSLTFYQMTSLIWLIPGLVTAKIASRSYLLNGLLTGLNLICVIVLIIAGSWLYYHIRGIPFPIENAAFLFSILSVASVFFCVSGAALYWLIISLTRRLKTK